MHFELLKMHANSQRDFPEDLRSKDSVLLQFNTMRRSFGLKAQVFWEKHSDDSVKIPQV